MKIVIHSIELNAKNFKKTDTIVMSSLFWRFHVLADDGKSLPTCIRP